MRRWAIINTLLGALVLLLGLAIARTWARVLPPIEVTARAPAAPAGGQHEKGKRGGDKAGARAQQQTPAMLVAAVADKDLFDPSRHPAPPEEMKQPEQVREVGPPQGVTVVGMRIVGKDREVFVTDASQGNQQKRLRVGDQVAGYTVKTIEAAAVTLTSPSGDAVTMPLAVEKGKQAVARGGPKPAVSPAAGVATTSTAAGVVKPQTPPPQAPPGAAGARLGGQNPQVPQLPNDVRQKLDQLKRNDPNSRMGRKQR